MFQFLTHVELSRSMVAILEMPQYVAYQKNAVYAFIKLSAKSHSFNILRTMDGLSCSTIITMVYYYHYYLCREITSREISGTFAPFQKRTLYLHVKPYLMCMESHFPATHGCLVY